MLTSICRLNVLEILDSNTQHLLWVTVGFHTPVVLSEAKDLVLLERLYGKTYSLEMQREINAYLLNPMILRRMF